MIIAICALAATALVVGGVIAFAGDGGDEDGDAATANVSGGPEPVVRRPAKAGKQPNIIAITTDDQTLEQFRRRYMPKAYRLLVDEGTSFRDSIATTPLCCPSRASFITGQYGHNNGVLTNSPGYLDLRKARNTLPSWLQRAGYRTAHVGKYLNRFEQATDDPAETPPGWDSWYTMVPAKEYYDYDLAINGELESFGSEDEDYLTRVLDDAAVGAIRRLGEGRRPYYLQFDQFAPHNGGDGGMARGERCAGLPVPDPRDEGSFAGKSLPLPRSFNRISDDQPPFIRDEKLGPQQIAKQQLSRRCALESLQAVDRSIERIDRVLRSTGQDKRTVVIFTSDNGKLHGEHRISSKLLPYEETVGVPLVMRIPPRYLDGRQAVGEVSEPVANIDLAPTILDLADGRPCVGGGSCRTMDGRSLVGLVGGRSGGFPEDRPLGIEFKGSKRPSLPRPCSYNGVRTRGEVYVQYPSISVSGNGSCRDSNVAEYYDLRTDPDQIDNLLPARSGSKVAKRQRQLAKLAERLNRCAGIKGRDPRKGDRPFCS